MSQERPLRHGGRLEIRIDPNDVGQRVTVRHRLGTKDLGPNDPEFTDIVGELLSWGDDEVVIRRRTGEEVGVPLRLIVAAKTIPPARSTGSSGSSGSSASSGSSGSSGSSRPR